MIMLHFYEDEFITLLLILCVLHKSFKRRSECRTSSFTPSINLLNILLYRLEIRVFSYILLDNLYGLGLDYLNST